MFSQPILIYLLISHLIFAFILYVLNCIQIVSLALQPQHAMSTMLLRSMSSVVPWKGSMVNNIIVLSISRSSTILCAYALFLLNNVLFTQVSTNGILFTAYALAASVLLDFSGVVRKI